MQVEDEDAADDAAPEIGMRQGRKALNADPKERARISRENALATQERIRRAQQELEDGDAFVARWAARRAEIVVAIPRELARLDHLELTEAEAENAVGIEKINAKMVRELAKYNAKIKRMVKDIAAMKANEVKAGVRERAPRPMKAGKRTKDPSFSDTYIPRLPMAQDGADVPRVGPAGIVAPKPRTA